MRIGDDFLNDYKSRLQPIQPPFDVRVGDDEPDNNVSEELFKLIFEASSKAAEEASAVTQEMTAKLLTGQLEDMPGFMIAGERSGIIRDLNMTMRNKVLDAYNEVMKFQV